MQSTLSEVADTLEKRGFTHDFIFQKNGIRDIQTGQHLSPKEFKIIEACRFEGISDPDDNEVIYALESRSGLKGLLIDAYGPYADRLKADFICQIQLTLSHPQILCI